MSRVLQKLAVGGVTALVFSGPLLGCGSAGGQPDGGHPGGCASACTFQLTGDNDGDDSTEVPGGQETFNCDDAPIATWVVAAGSEPPTFNFIIGRSGTPDISVDLTLADVPTAGTSYAGTTTEVGYLVTGSSAGPAFFSDPAINGSSTFVFCSVEAGQAAGNSQTYTVHGRVDAVLEPYQPPNNEAPESIVFHAQF